MAFHGFICIQKDSICKKKEKKKLQYESLNRKGNNKPLRRIIRTGGEIFCSVDYGFLII